jgi:salicylate hydroxylase
MMPDQSQGACMAIEDAACLGLVFGKTSFKGNIRKSLEIYQKVRKPRATKVQEASARARENIHERIGKKFSAWGRVFQVNGMSGFSSNTENSLYSVKDEGAKLTIDEMNL